VFNIIVCEGFSIIVCEGFNIIVCDDLIDLFEELLNLATVVFLIKRLEFFMIDYDYD
jgi:hypothetical protein